MSDRPGVHRAAPAKTLRGNIDMFGFFGIGRAGRKQRDDTATDFASLPSSSLPLSTQQHTATHRELVRVVLRDTLRMNGIPPEWVGCEVLTRSRSVGDPVLQIQVLIHQWHEGLLRYAPLIQQQLLQALQRFDPATDHSRHTVVWRFSPACECPYTSMPEPGYWTSATALPKFDLAPSDLSHLDNGFAPTQQGQWR